MYKKIALVLFFISSVASAQEIIKGIVVDEKKQPLLGANIIWQKTSSGTTSDEKGNFSIEKPAEFSILEISYEGFETQKIELQRRNKSAGKMLGVKTKKNFGKSNRISN